MTRNPPSTPSSAARRLAGSRRSPATAWSAPASRTRSCLAGSYTSARTRTPLAARAGTTSPANCPVAPMASTRIRYPQITETEYFVHFSVTRVRAGTRGRLDEHMADVNNPRAPRSDAARNRQVLVRAAVTAVHREGPRVPMATIAADAGVGIGTLYRHFPSREDLLDYLTHTSFERVLANAQDAERGATTAAEALRRFIEAAISQRNELVLPLHGGPPLNSPQTRAVREQVHRLVLPVLDRGRAE